MKRIYPLRKTPAKPAKTTEAPKAAAPTTHKFGWFTIPADARVTNFNLPRQE